MDNIKLSHISTSCLVRMLIRNAWMILLAAWTFSMAAGIYLNTLWTPQYRATMTYAVQSRNTSVYGAVSQSAADEVTSVLSSLLPTNLVVNKIRAWHPDLADFNGSLSAEPVGSSNFVIITCQDDTPDDALLSLLALEDIFPEIAEYISTSAVTVVIRDPSVSGGMVNAVNVPQLRRTAATVGGIAMTALLVWFFLKRDTVQTRTGARHQLDADIITYVGRVRRQMSLRSIPEIFCAPTAPPCRSSPPPPASPTASRSAPSAPIWKMNTPAGAPGSSCSPASVKTKASPPSPAMWPPPWPCGATGWPSSTATCATPA